MRTGKLLRGERILAEPVELATGFFERLRGLLGRDSMPAGSAMVIEHCCSVHTVGMSFPVDLVFLDREWRVVGIRRDVKPGRPMVCGGLRASRVVESQVGGLDLDSLGCGEKLSFIPVGG